MAKKKHQDNTLGILSHILGLLTGFIGPLIIFLSTEEKEGREHAKNALNWQFSLMIYFVVGLLLVFVFVGIIVLPILGLLNAVFCIIAAVKANEGKFWKYPISIPFFKLKK